MYSENHPLFPLAQSYRIGSTVNSSIPGTSTRERQTVEEGRMHWRREQAWIVAAE